MQMMSPDQDKALKMMLTFGIGIILIHLASECLAVAMSSWPIRF